MAGDIYLTARGLYKKFDHVEALRGADIEVSLGEIVAIVGDNGAGKTTLIKVLSGVLSPDEGRININGHEFKELSTHKAIENGISTVYQDLALGNTMDVTANLFLGKELTKGGFLNKKKMNQEARKLIEELGIQIPDVTVPVGNLSGGQRQGVAVARLVHQGGRIMIFDEPTAAMGLNESQGVLRLLKELAGKNFGVIIISHNLPHVFQISDRICVMRQGKIVKELKTSETNTEEIVSLITGSAGYDL